VNRYVLILGASSDIAKSIAMEYAQKGYSLILAGRNLDEISKDANDINIRYNINAIPAFFDALDFNSHSSFFHSLNPKPVGVICALGYLGNQKDAELNFNESYRIIATNYSGCVSILNIAANYFENVKEGFIVGISSVAGDRGRGSNYFYGSAKAGFSEYLSGLRNRLHKSDIQVLTVKPGFVYTKMTKNLNLPKLLTAIPQRVASDIVKAQQTKKNVIYTPWFWRYIMIVIKLIPENIFKKLSL
jgi:decaprenylphospho-beta-D-erythro-pentofuranosid-2-ulose 2-reductase